MTFRRAGFGAVFIAAGAALAVFGVIIASGDPYDIGRAGLIIFGAVPIGVGCVLLAVGALLLRRGSAVAGRAWLAVAVAAGALLSFGVNWVLSLMLIILALAIVASGWKPPHWSESPARRRRTPRASG